MIRSIYRKRDGTLRTNLDSGQMSRALRDRHGLLWVDLSCESREVCEPILQNTFGFHPLAVDDALEEALSPKVDDWGEYLYVALREVFVDQDDDGNLNTAELDVFVGRNYVVTYQARAIAAVERVWDECQRDPRQMGRGAAYLLYRLADQVVDGYMPVIEEIDDAIDRIEDEIFDDPGPNILQQLFGLKRALLRLRRTIGPQREVFYRLGRGDYDVINDDHPAYFRDVYDHLVRLHDIAESLRDLVGSALDTYLSVVNNRMNDVMKTLTVITTLFMPLSFLSGFFGMNFFQPTTPLPAWTNLAAFSLTLSVMALVPIAMFLWMRRRGWM